MPKLSDLPPPVRKAFDLFVSNANKGVLHQLDWGRFYAFIRRCHEESVRLSEVEVSELLERAGFEEEYARRIGSVYDHGRKILGGAE